jgi:hypothetical protein
LKETGGTFIASCPGRAAELNRGQHPRQSSLELPRQANVAHLG